MTIRMEDRVRRAEHQVSSKLGEEIAILNLKSSLYFGLENTGAVIWEAISQPKQVAEICEAVTSQFDVSEERCQLDVIQLLEELAKAELIVIESYEASSLP